MARPAADAVVWLLSDDPAVGRAANRVCADSGASLIDSPPPEGTPCVVIADAAHPHPGSVVQDIRVLLPEAFILGFMAAPDPQTWRNAERAGYDEVASRGAIGPSLRRAIGRLAQGGDERAIAICDAGEVAGRIGFLMQAEVPGIGELSLFRERGQLVCLGTCPHQGAPLGRGEIEEGIVTCPAHGSRFDILTGERVRGPSDFDAACYRAFEKGGRVWIVPRG